MLDHHADVVSILIGINDTWRRYDSREETSAAQFEGAYCAACSTRSPQPEAGWC